MNSKSYIKSLIKKARMKSLALKTFKVGDQDVKYAELIKNCLNFAPKEGLDAENMRRRIRVMDVLDKSTDTLELEDADAETLKSVVSLMPWAVLSRDLLEMLDAIKAL